MTDRLRRIPAVGKVLQALGATGLPRPLVITAVRCELAALRSEPEIPEFAVVLDRVRHKLEALSRTRIQPVINGTGILAHTNLGRAPLGPGAINALAATAADYNNLEFDLAGGERGSRGAYVEQSLAQLCGAEAATIVNNCAAALVLAIRYFTRNKPEVVISRGELVQIGGGFRIPEILAASGARLREIGTTNKTALSDYASALGTETGLILTVHRSNFFMDGFVESPGTEELAALAHQRRVPFLEDVGSGALIATDKLAGLEHEPTPAEVLRRGVDLVTFSGDKLLGGPQAGIIAGRAKWIAALKREPFFRALRCDKLILAALQATAECYLEQRWDELPLVAMLQADLEALRQRGQRMVAALNGPAVHCELGRGKAQIGGGTLPRSALESVTLDLLPSSLTLAELSERLRRNRPPVISYASRKRVRLDLRTIFPRQDQMLIEAIAAAVSAPKRGAD